MMICHLPDDPLNAHARHALLYNKKSANSWFQQIRDICLMYGLDHPLHFLEYPPTKLSFKAVAKERVSLYWENIYKEEAATLPSLECLVTESCSLSSPHLVWSTASGNSFECRKASILAKMMSGRFRSDYLCRATALLRLVTSLQGI